MMYERHCLLSLLSRLHVNFISDTLSVFINCRVGFSDSNLAILAFTSSVTIMPWQQSYLQVGVIWATRPTDTQLEFSAIDLFLCKHVDVHYQRFIFFK
jgi:hypothetical protein